MCNLCFLLHGWQVATLEQPLGRFTWRTASCWESPGAGSAATFQNSQGKSYTLPTLYSPLRPPSRSQPAAVSSAFAVQRVTKPIPTKGCRGHLPQVDSAGWAQARFRGRGDGSDPGVRAFPAAVVPNRGLGSRQLRVGFSRPQRQSERNRDGN